MSSLNTSQTQASYTLGDKLRGYLSLARVSNTPTVVSNVLAGAAIAGATGISPTLGIVALSMALFYTAGMYLNDVLDYEIDAQERPERPLPSGLISLTEAKIITAALFVVALGLLLTVGIAAFVGGVVLAGLIVLYDAWHKANALSPVIMGATRFMVYIIAFMAMGAAFSWTIALAGGLLWLYIIALTAIAKHETGNFVGRYWQVAAVLLPALIYAPTLITQPLGVLALLAFVGWTLYSLRFAYRDENKQIGRTIVSLIAGIALLDAMVALAYGAELFALIAAGAFVLTVALQRVIKGT